MVEPAVDKQWVTYPEAKRFTGLSQTTLWRYVARGEIEAARIGRAVRINRRSLNEFMDRHAHQPKLPGFDDVD